MKTFYIDFEGYCAIEAETVEEAKVKFWKNLQRPSAVCFDDVYEIIGVEEKEI